MATKIIFLILFVLDLLLTGFLGWSMAQTHLISSQLVIIAALLLALIPMLLFALQVEKKKQKKKTGFRVAAIVLLLFMGIVEGAVSYYLYHYNNKIDRVTEVRTQYTQVEIYVMDEDNAQTMDYAMERRYVFGVIQGADYDAVNQTRENMEKKYERSMNLTICRSTTASPRGSGCSIPATCRPTCWRRSSPSSSETRPRSPWR